MESDIFWISLIIIGTIFCVWVFVKCCSMIRDSANQRNEQKSAVVQSKSAVWNEYNTVAQKLAYVHELQRSGRYYVKGFYITQRYITSYSLNIIFDNLDGPINNAIKSFENYKKLIFNMYGPEEKLKLNIYQWSERDRKVINYINIDLNDALWKSVFGHTGMEFGRHFDFLTHSDTEMIINEGEFSVGKTRDGKYTYFLSSFDLGHVGSDELERKTHNEAMKMICQAISAEFGSNYILNEQGNSVYYYFY